MGGMAHLSWLAVITLSLETAAQAQDLPHRQRCSTAMLPTQRWARDMRHKDLSDVMALFARNPRFEDPSGQKFRGRRAIQSLYAHVFATFDSDIILTERARESSETSCVQRGTYREELRNRTSGAVTHSTGAFKFTYILDAAGMWRIAGQIWTAR